MSILLFRFLTIQSYWLHVFGDTKPIKDVLKGLNGLFRANLTYNGERRAGWIYSKKQEQKVREALATCVRV